ncbi:uncharacterized protein LOC126983700 isoform X2 [Eriocheir sinensis]|nr:uncharacterized protein LOC126983700 isoform X2 [Eriocheir sinensis]
MIGTVKMGRGGEGQDSTTPITLPITTLPPPARLYRDSGQENGIRSSDIDSEPTEEGSAHLNSIGKENYGSAQGNSIRTSYIDSKPIGNDLDHLNSISKADYGSFYSLHDPKRPQTDRDDPGRPQAGTDPTDDPLTHWRRLKAIGANMRSILRKLTDEGHHEGLSLLYSLMDVEDYLTLLRTAYLSLHPDLRHYLLQRLGDATLGTKVYPLGPLLDILPDPTTVTEIWIPRGLEVIGQALHNQSMKFVNELDTIEELMLSSGFLQEEIDQILYLVGLPAIQKQQVIIRPMDVQVKDSDHLNFSRSRNEDVDKGIGGGYGLGGVGHGQGKDGYEHRQEEGHQQKSHHPQRRPRDTQDDGFSDMGFRSSKTGHGYQSIGYGDSSGNRDAGNTNTDETGQGHVQDPHQGLRKPRSQSGYGYETNGYGHSGYGDVASASGHGQGHGGGGYGHQDSYGHSGGGYGHSGGYGYMQYMPKYHDPLVILPGLAFLAFLSYILYLAASGASKRSIPDNPTLELDLSDLPTVTQGIEMTFDDVKDLDAEETVRVISTSLNGLWRSWGGGGRRECLRMRLCEALQLPAFASSLPSAAATLRRLSLVSLAHLLGVTEAGRTDDQVSASTWGGGTKDTHTCTRTPPLLTAPCPDTAREGSAKG